MVLSITRAAGSCGNFPQLHTPAAWLPHGVLTEKCGACHCGKGRAVKNHLWSSLGVPVNTNLGGGGSGGGGIKVLGRARESKTQRSVCTPAHIPHRIGRPHGILPQCVRERGIDSNQKWDVRPGEELQGI